MRRYKGGFSLIELMVITAVVAILATIIIVDTRQSRQNARDVNRKQSVGEISLSLEQRFSTAKTYFVEMPGTGTHCDASLTDPYATTGDMYMSATDPLNTRCVGYKGGGAGRLNGKNHPDAPSYPNLTSSIADALFQGGYLASVPIDPLNTDFTNYGQRDFLITLCDSQGKPATSPSNAINYGVYAQLESSITLGSQDIDTTTHSCGASSSTYPFDYQNYP